MFLGENALKCEIRSSECRMGRLVFGIEWSDGWVTIFEFVFVRAGKSGLRALNRGILSPGHFG